MSISLRPRLLAAAVSLCFIAPATVAQTGQTSSATPTLDPVVVTGARFDAEPSLAPIGATVITADDIRRAGASDVNAAIRKIGGVYGRQSLDGSPDFGLDLRGFGTNSSQNMVVVLDGVRLSENELRNTVLSTIPVDSVERIEILRGGASVLYGEGATGGVINIVTKRPDQRAGRGSVFVEGGQFNAGEARVSAAQAWAGFAADATIGHQRTDNYRDNNDFRQTQFNGGLQWYNEAGRIGVRYEGARQDNRFAGSLTEARYLTNPRQTLTPNDHGSLDSDRLTAFGQYRVAGHDVAAELSYRKRSIDSVFVSGNSRYASTYDTRQLQFSPRVRKLGALRGMVNELVVGLDFSKWERDAATGAPINAHGEQKSKALYVRDELRFDPVHEGRLSAGVRRELFDKNYRDPLNYATTGYDVTQGLNAWEVQLSYMPLRGLTVFGKAGQSYRLANIDENAGTPVINQVLDPQKSKDLELGASYADTGRGSKLTARVFRSQLTNEIFYDPTIFANTNLDPTERKGFELDAEQRIATDWSVTAHYQYVDATFRAGVNSGRQMTLVPENTVTARLKWTPASGHSADIGVQWVDQQRYGNDFTNICSGQIPSYTTVDARYARRLGQWEFALAGLNLADKRYYSQAFACKAGIYTADGRQLKLSARYEF